MIVPLSSVLQPVYYDDVVSSRHYHHQRKDTANRSETVGWLVVLGLMALSDSISVYIGPSPREREKEARNDR